jgi:hypothetical protein
MQFELAIGPASYNIHHSSVPKFYFLLTVEVILVIVCRKFTLSTAKGLTLYFISFRCLIIYSSSLTNTLTNERLFSGLKIGYPIAVFKSPIKSSASSIPTLNRINESDKPFLILSSLGMDAWVIEAG